MTSMPTLDTIIQQAAQVHTLPQFKSWMRDHVRLALPHGALACVHGGVHAAGVSIDYLITVDYPIEHLDAIRNTPKRNCKPSVPPPHVRVSSGKSFPAVTRHADLAQP